MDEAWSRRSFAEGSSRGHELVAAMPQAANNVCRQTMTGFRMRPSQEEADRGKVTAKRTLTATILCEQVMTAAVCRRKCPVDFAVYDRMM